MARSTECATGIAAPSTRVHGLRIGLASPEEIRAWSSGEVLTPGVLDALTLKPEPGGLLCERIFGPYRDWECGCGRLKGRDKEGRICRGCGVRVGRPIVRRERMGHVELAAPVVHPWFLRGAPGRLALLLDCPPRALERVVAHDAWLVLAVDTPARDALLTAPRATFAEEAGTLADEPRELVTAVAAREARAVAVARADAGAPRAAGETPRGHGIGRGGECGGGAAGRREAEGRARLLAALRPGLILTEAQCAALDADAGSAGLVRLGTGGAAVREALAALDLERAAADCRAALAGDQPGRRIAARLRLIEALRRGGVRPEWAVLTVLPVLPADLRPVVALPGGRFAASDLNELYGRVIARNNRLKTLREHRAPEIILRNERRLLQAAVDALIDNGRLRSPTVGRRGKAPLQSLSDRLRGKGGRLRRNLLGKRVDYSARSVIAVGPGLRLGQCGLPARLALELFKPFVMRAALAAGLVTGARGAKRLVERADDAVWPLLARAMRGKVVLLNRAPTLHMGSLQAFDPVLLDPGAGDAIRLHPLACGAFNADFDGDQMAVHLPLSAAAQAEARALLHARTNLLSAASGAPALVPQQDIVLGCYSLTLAVPGARGEGKAFADVTELELAYEHGVVELGATVRVRLAGEAGLRATTAGRVLFHEALRAALAGHGAGVAALGFRDEALGARALARLLADCHARLGGAAMVELADAIKDVGFRWSTRSGLSIGWSDLAIPPEKAGLLAAANAEEAAIRRDHERGTLSEEERRAALVALWTGARDRVAAAVRAGLDPQGSLAIMVDSGARGNANQLTQLAGMRGLVTDASGQVLPTPIKANYREGIPALQYFMMSNGARKGATDRSLRTADAGYLTRRLVDVAQDVLVTEEDCETADGLAVPLPTTPDPEGDLRARVGLRGRYLARPLAGHDGGPFVPAGAALDDTTLALLLALPRRPAAVAVRSPLRCVARRGVCRRCYGLDPATGGPVALGAAVGVIAAQSIGEPGTQLTMRTFQLGGVASATNITGGLPRVEELFEAARPRGAALLAPGAGTVVVEGGEPHAAGTGLTIVLQPHGAAASAPPATDRDRAGWGDIWRIPVPAGRAPIVATGERVVAGQALTDGHRDPHALLALVGRAATEDYLVGEIADVYRGQGVDLDPRHIELIVGRMTRWATVEDGGGTPLLPGELVALADLAADDAAAGRRPASVRATLLGVTRAALASDSFLAAAGFQETTGVLADAALARRVDRLRSLKANVLLGRRIPAGTGYSEQSPVSTDCAGQRT